MHVMNRTEAAIGSLKDLAAKAHKDNPESAAIMAQLHEALLPALMAVTSAALRRGAITGENEDKDVKALQALGGSATLDDLPLYRLDDPDDNFNPLHYIAQHLMRNNPRFAESKETKK